MKIRSVLDQIDMGAMALPEFQRGFVWNRDQVRGLMHSLYRKHPIGSLLIWVTETKTASVRGDGELAPGSVKLLLDGQQRITSLYGIIRGRPPEFFDGNEESEGALDRLITQLRHVRGDLRVQAGDFLGWSRGARFYPLLYMLTRVCRAVDWDTGVELSSTILGNLSQLQLHHIFPKSRLYKCEYPRAEVNALANFTFLTQETNLLVSNRLPENYLPEFLAKQPGAIESHWIPMDENLWKIENYPDFLAARRELLAKAANDFFDSLLAGEVPEAEAAPAVLERTPAAVPGGVEGEDEELQLMECRQWVIEQGLPEGEYMYELADAETGTPLAVLDLAWPNGLQEGLSQPVALLIDEGPDVEGIVNRAGYRFFTCIETFKKYVHKDVLATGAIPEEVGT